MVFFFKMLDRFLFLYWQIAGYWLGRFHGVDIGKGCRFYGLPIFDRCADSKIVVGKNVVLCSNSRFTALGVNHPVILRTLRAGANLYVGDDSGLSGTTICAARSVHIGKGVLLGANVAIFDTDFHAKSPENRRYCTDPEKIAVKPVKISDNVFVGVNSVITKGVNIGTNSIVGAGSVVTKDVGESTICAGNPAKDIGNVE